ncbi:ESX secretion-associated protein EspG [Pseudonocardia phyllosphaerae]|uniref:ESX secretion-associated protein EspG n=1 Tax=Pseudonocardia phyllosphaerae TaxID=3390502 RepID=UPI00397B2E89
MPEPGRRLSDAEFDAVWDLLGLGAQPGVLRLRTPPRSRDDRRGITARGLAGLRGRGLAGPSGPDPGLVRLLMLLASPARLLEVRGHFGAPWRALAAERGDEAVLAVRTGGAVVVGPAGPPPHAVAAALPSWTGERGCTARIGAVAHDRWGSPRHAPGHVDVVDTPAGRTVTGPGGAGDPGVLLAALLTAAGGPLGPGPLSPGRSAASAAVRPR